MPRMTESAGGGGSSAAGELVRAFHIYEEAEFREQGRAWKLGSPEH